MDTTVSYFTLSNGLRAVHRLCPGEVEYCGVAVNAGSRDELSPDRYGLAHFVEHTIFKGTRHRRAWHIINRMEAVGGELNAYTTKEETYIYSTFPSGNLSRAAELIADLIRHSSFPTAEIERERDVVADEIDSYSDVPSDGIYDDFEDKIFAGSPLGHNILGTRQALDGMTSEVCRNYLDEYYTPGQMVFFYSGPMAAGSVERIVSRHFGCMNLPDRDRRRVAPQPVATFDDVKEISSHQSHVVMGARVGGMFSPDRHALALLTNILGGPGMNSLLNVELRERRGLVYTIDASTGLLTDTGLFTIYFGCDHADVSKCRRLVTNTIDRIAQGGFDDRRLAAARRQYAGQLVIASTHAEQTTLSMGRSMLYYGNVAPLSVTLDRIKALSVDDIVAAARRLTDLSVLTLR